MTRRGSTRHPALPLTAPLDVSLTVTVCTPEVLNVTPPAKVWAPSLHREWTWRSPRISATVMSRGLGERFSRTERISSAKSGVVG